MHAAERQPDHRHAVGLELLAHRLDLLAAALDRGPGVLEVGDAEARAERREPRVVVRVPNARSAAGDHHRLAGALRLDLHAEQCAPARPARR
jgi:hypothetical protein